MPAPKDKKGPGGSPPKKGKAVGKKADDAAAKNQQFLSPEDRDIYQEPIKKIVRPANQVSVHLCCLGW
jgi:hypothetical protein